jgi:hypothetical protein
MAAKPSASIPASGITYDDTLTDLGVTNLQAAVEILLARIAALEAAQTQAGTLDFFDPSQSGNFPET